MECEATVRLTVKVRFRVAGGRLPENATPAQAAAVEQERIAAAQHAEQTIVARLTKAVGTKGELVGVLVEEVAER